jgi:hypothetical protein
MSAAVRSFAIPPCGEAGIGVLANLRREGRVQRGMGYGFRWVIGRAVCATFIWGASGAET